VDFFGISLPYIAWKNYNDIIKYFKKEVIMVFIYLVGRYFAE
jgi:hypothetical protein